MQEITIMPDKAKFIYLSGVTTKCKHCEYVAKDVVEAEMIRLGNCLNCDKLADHYNLLVEYNEQMLADYQEVGYQNDL